MEIVKLQKGEIKNALELIWLVFEEFEAPDYSKQGVATFKDFISYDSIIEKVDKGDLIFWGCFMHNNLAGVIAIRDINHICMLFVKKEYHRQGIARNLFQTVVDYCKTDDSINNITVNSSPFAVEVYHHLGFKDTNTEQTVDGIRFTPMEYQCSRINKVWAVFFSATGTTRKVATEIANLIAEKLGVECEYYDFSLPVARTNVLKFTENDLVIFGTPVYAGRVPNVLLKYLVTIEGNGAAAVPLVLYGNRDYDDGLIELRDILEKDRFHTIAAAAFIGEHSFSDILAKGRPDALDMVIASNFADKIVGKLRAGVDITSMEPINVKGVPYPYRGYYQPRDRSGNSIDIRKVKPLTNSDCNNCKICADICPMGSISHEDILEYIGICIKCGACIKKCPKHARYYEDSKYLYHQHELEEALTRRAEPELFL